MSTLETLPKWATKLAVFDTETTGIDTRTSRIVSACVALLDQDGKITQEYDWLVDPGVEIPPQASRVHGITTAEARANGQEASAAIAAITDVIQQMFSAGIPVVAYNAAYDFSLLDSEQKRYGVPGFSPAAKPIIDPMIIDKQVDKYRRGKRTLTAATEHYNVTFTDAHSAAPDAIAAGRVALAMARKYSEELALSAVDLHDAQVQWAKTQNDSYAAWRRANGKPDFHSSGAWPIR